MISPEVSYPRQQELIREGERWLSMPGLTPESLRERISHADLLLADLDDTDARSPAKMIATKFLWRGGLFNPKFLSWGFKTRFTILRDGQKAESGAWESFLASFRENGEVLKIINQFTPQLASQISYPGVEKFYQNVSCPKVYISRNIAEVVGVFAKAFGFSQIFAEEYYKKRVLSEVCRTYPLAKKFIVRGNSLEDAEIIQLLKDKKEQGEIEDVISICVCRKSKKPAFTADIYTSPDQTLLVKVLNESG